MTNGERLEAFLGATGYDILNVFVIGLIILFFILGVTHDMQR